MMAATAPTTIDPKLLDILRCPVAVHYTNKGEDPGRLELVRDYWLFCADSGHKYPIIDGIPKMLIEEGAKWKQTEIEDLPVPPPNEPIYEAAEDAVPPGTTTQTSGLSPIGSGLPWKAILLGLVMFFIVTLLLRRRGTKSE